MTLTSPAFPSDGHIPIKYTCDGDDVSPPIEWRDVPAGTRTLALICDDPDAPKKDFVHWVLFNVPSSSTGLPEHVPGQRELPDGSRQGRNDFGRIGYGGPCPPSGTHRYHFTLYAVDAALGLPAGSTRDAFMKALDGHVVESARMTASYQRSGQRSR